MKKLFILFFLLLSCVVYAQTPNATNTKFTGGLAAPNGTPPKPTVGLTAGAIHYTTGVGFQVYNGSAWVTLGVAGSGVTDFTAGFGLTPTSLQTGSVTSRVDSSQVQTVSNFFPKGDTRWARTGFTGTVTSITPGYGLTPQTPIISTGGFGVDTLVLDTVYAKISGTGNYIKNQTDSPQIGAFYTQGESRLTNAGNTTPLTIDNGGAQEGLIINNTAGGIGHYIENDLGIGMYLYGTSGSNELLFLDNRNSDPAISIENNTVNGTGHALNYDKDGVNKARIDNAGNISGQSFIKSGGISTQALMADGSVYSLQDSLNTRVKKSGDTMTGTLNGTDIVLSNNLEADSVKVIGGLGTQALMANGSLTSATSAATANTIVQRDVNGDAAFRYIATQANILGSGLTYFAGNNNDGNGTIQFFDVATAKTALGANGAALTKVDDANVTLTLGGSPSTALLNAASLSLGWAGTLSVARGGTGSSTQNFVDLTTPQTVAGNKTLTGVTNTAQLKAQGPANDFTSYFTGSATTGQSYGPIVLAGTNSSDLSFSVRDQTNTLQYFNVIGNGNIGVGTVTPTSTSSAKVVHLDGIGASAEYRLTNNGTGVGVNDGVSLLLAGTDAYLFNREAGNLYLGTNGVSSALTINSSQNATFSSQLGINGVANSVTSGTYTPTLTNTLNVSSSTANLSIYSRVGNTVTVSGYVDITPTGSGLGTIKLSLPIASDFTLGTDAIGSVSCGNTVLNSLYILGDGTSDTANLSFNAASSSATNAFYSFQYLVK